MKRSTIIAVCLLAFAPVEFLGLLRSADVPSVVWASTRGEIVIGKQTTVFLALTNGFLEFPGAFVVCVNADQWAMLTNHFPYKIRTNLIEFVDESTQ